MNQQFFRYINKCIYDINNEEFTYMQRKRLLFTTIWNMICLNYCTHLEFYNLITQQYHKQLHIHGHGLRDIEVRLNTLFYGSDVSVCYRLSNSKNIHFKFHNFHEYASIPETTIIQVIGNEWLF